MATVEVTEGRERTGRGAGSSRRSKIFRTFATGCAALVLVSGAYQAAQGQGLEPDYPTGGGLSTAETVAVGVAAAAAIAALAGTGALAGIAGAGHGGCPQ